MDDSLYAGSAAFYPTGRLPYPPLLAEVLRDELGLDGTGRLLDVGCGPGSLTLLLAPLVAEAVGVDADADMLREAARAATTAGITNVSWRHLRAESLPTEFGTFRLATFAQSFHWMDRALVARPASRAARTGRRVGPRVSDHATAGCRVATTRHRGTASTRSCRPTWGRCGAPGRRSCRMAPWEVSRT